MHPAAACLHNGGDRANPKCDDYMWSLGRWFSPSFFGTMRVSNVDAPHFGHGGRSVALLGENDSMAAHVRISA